MSNHGPEFTAYEINALRMKKDGPAANAKYYEKCFDFLMQYEEGLQYERMSEKQQRWIWGIKAMVGDWV
jgi:hypothetical protein